MCFSKLFCAIDGVCNLGDNEETKQIWSPISSGCQPQVAPSEPGFNELNSLHAKQFSACYCSHSVLVFFLSILYLFFLNSLSNSLSQKKWKMYWSFSASTFSNTLTDISVSTKTQCSAVQNLKHKNIYIYYYCILCTVFTVYLSQYTYTTGQKF